MTTECTPETLETALRGRIDIDPEKVEQGLVKLVLMLVETVRQVVERQAIRRVEGGTLSEEEIERLGLALLRLEEKMTELRQHFDLEEADLTLKLHIPLEGL
ncbi:gas vesicle protein K [Ancylobacter dichloromethanicus]|uniref:Gas vesicle protein GvpK n=1 Tax=Ancylobacter dichloromethanicus TaxID=518825 RepID=A0A9W6J5Z0_9HYPH|nr:gas vesicle protein K [Ancylobacter dichloromethanicus]MBS7554277.1 gas vesicle protein K [Ancylobacter dichloromethanicus]GLK71401.1 gas vesicle protein GvpK [Ancylobacter dichloromethanicus]